MKKIFLFLVSTASLHAFAQQKMVSQAIITTKTTIVAPEGEDDQLPPPAQAGGEGQQVTRMRFGGAGETKSVTYVKNNMVKTVINSDMGRTSTIRDNEAKKTTTLMEMMGKQTGFYSTDAEMAEAQKKMDSMMQSRGAGSNTASPAKLEVVEATGSKKIAGYDCSKAYVITTREKIMLGSDGSVSKLMTTDTSTVWYTPAFKVQGLNSTGSSGPMLFGNRAGIAAGLDKINGFPLMYETKMQRGRKMIVEVQKIETDKEIKDKEFEIPKDFELRSMKDMQNAGPGNIQFRFGG